MIAYKELHSNSKTPGFWYNHLLQLADDQEDPNPVLLELYYPDSSDSSAIIDDFPETKEGDTEDSEVVDDDDATLPPLDEAE